MTKIPRLLAAFVFFGISLGDAAPPPAARAARRAGGEAKIKNCLAAAYTAEQNFHHTHQRYTRRVLSLSLMIVPDCKDLVITISDIAVSEFTISVADRHSRWTVDHSRTMTRLR